MSILQRELTGTAIAGILSPQVPLSDYENALGEITQFVTLEDTSAYITTIQGINSIASVGRQWTPTKHNQSFMIGQIKIPVYNLNANFSIDRVQRARINKTLSKSNAGTTIESLYDSLCAQGIAMKVRAGVLWGYDSGEGILANATSFTFGNDGAGGSTIKSFNTAILARRLADMALEVVNATKNTQSLISILTSQRIYNYIAKSQIQSTDYLQLGSSVSVLDYVKQVVEAMGRKCLIGYEPTFANADTTGTKDAIFVNAPGIRTEQGEQVQGVIKDLNAVGFDGTQIKFNSFVDIGSAGVYKEVDPYANGIYSGNWYASVTCGATIRANTAQLAWVDYQ